MTAPLYQFDLPATVQFRALIDRYGRMQRGEDLTAQRRGQLFNELIADLLQAWGVSSVYANVRSLGEIDVAFAVDGTRFLLEAKWQQAPVDMGPIAKISRRITQRLAGTRGIFLSMSGYSDELLDDIDVGQQPDTLLLDRTHFEAMLSGLLSPSHLFRELVNRASFRGDLYVPLTELLVPTRQPPLPALKLGNPPADRVSVVVETAPGIDAQMILHGEEPVERIAEGLAIDGASRLLLTTPAGIASISLDTGAMSWTVPIPDCRANPIPLDDGSVLVLHGATVLRWHHNEVQIVAGGFTGGSYLLRGPGGEIWVFDYKGQAWGPDRLLVTLTRLGAALGQEERHVVDFRAHIWNAVWLSGRCFYLAGDGHFGVIDLDHPAPVKIDDRLISPHPDQRGAIRFDERTVLTASRHGTVCRIDVETGQNTRLSKLDILALGCEMASGPAGTAYVLVHRGGPRSFIPIVVRLHVHNSA